MLTYADVCGAASSLATAKQCIAEDDKCDGVIADAAFVTCLTSGDGAAAAALLRCARRLNWRSR